LTSKQLLISNMFSRQQVADVKNFERQNIFDLIALT